MKKLKTGGLISAIVMFVLGVILIINPWQAVETLIKIAGIILIIAGLAGGIGTLKDGFQPTDVASLIGFGGAFVAGIIFLVRPYSISSLIHVFFGIIIIVHGIVNLLNALQLKSTNGWQVPLILSIISIIAGIFVFTGGAITTIVRVIGIVLIYNAAVSMFISLK